MKQLGISLKQKSSVIKKGENGAERKKEENKDYQSRCWLGPLGRVWCGGNLLFFFFFPPGRSTFDYGSSRWKGVIYNSAGRWILRNLRPRDHKNKTVFPETHFHNMRITVIWCCFCLLFWITTAFLKNCPLSEDNHCAVTLCGISKGVWVFSLPPRNSL